MLAQKHVKEVNSALSERLREKSLLSSSVEKINEHLTNSLKFQESKQLSCQVVSGKLNKTEQKLKEATIISRAAEKNKQVLRLNIGELKTRMEKENARKDFLTSEIQTYKDRFAEKELVRSELIVTIENQEVYF